MAETNVSRRSFLKGTGLLLAAPAIIRVADLMAIKAIEEERFIPKFTSFEGAFGYYENMTASQALSVSALWPGIKAWWGIEYAKLNPEDLHEMGQPGRLLAADA